MKIGDLAKLISFMPQDHEFYISHGSHILYEPQIDIIYDGGNPMLVASGNDQVGEIGVNADFKRVY